MNPFPWSFSKLKAFEQCPFQFYNEKVLKRYPQVESEAMLYGTRFHEAAEEYIRDSTPLPKAFLYSKDALDKLNALPGDKLCEIKMGVKADLTACEFDDEDVWWRGISDLNVMEPTYARVIDYKTGANAKYADTGQLELMALGTFAKYSDVERVKAGLLFVVAKAFIKASYTREDIPKLWTKWLSKFSKMEAAFEHDIWNKHPSGLCRRHCPVTECPHNGRR